MAKKRTQTFERAGKVFPGSPPLEPTPMERQRHKLWQQWHRYGRIKLAAAVGGNVDRERDARVDRLYRANWDSLASIKAAVTELHAVNESLSEFHSVILTHEVVEEALAILIRTGKRTLPRKKRKPATPVELVEKGFSVSVKHNDTSILLTPENYKRDWDELADERRTEIVELEAEWDELHKCKCPSHFDENGKRVA